MKCTRQDYPRKTFWHGRKSWVDSEADNSDGAPGAVVLWIFMDPHSDFISIHTLRPAPLAAPQHQHLKYLSGGSIPSPSAPTPGYTADALSIQMPPHSAALEEVKVIRLRQWFLMG